MNGYNALEWEASGNLKGLDITYSFTAIETDNHYHYITMWTLTSRKSRHQDSFQKVVNSFRIL